MFRTMISVTAVAALLTGCSDFKGTAIAAHPPASIFAGLLAVDMISVINTQKTLEDHVVSLITGKDCSVVRLSTGDNYCITPPPPRVPVTYYCYKTLAATSCYTTKLDSDESRYSGARVALVNR